MAKRLSATKGLRAARKPGDRASPQEYASGDCWAFERQGASTSLECWHVVGVVLAAPIVVLLFVLIASIKVLKRLIKGPNAPQASSAALVAEMITQGTVVEMKQRLRMNPELANARIELDKFFSKLNFYCNNAFWYGIPTQQVGDHFSFPLHLASRWGRVDMAELLVSYSADPLLVVSKRLLYYTILLW